MPEFLHSGNEKKEQVRSMFDGIANRYDFLNHFLSFGIDNYWRVQSVKALNLEKGDHLLDVACGTGDQGFSALKRTDIQVTGLDFSANMLSIADKKIKARNLTDKFRVVQGDAEALPFDDDTFEALSISYGIRNVGTIATALDEFFRVLKPGGRLSILEFAEPPGWFFGRLYRFYFDHVLPLMAGLFSSKSAYTYLPESVRHFPDREDFKALLKSTGFRRIGHKDLTFGVTTIYHALK
ncbi:MAG: bifunctional demethylmenaquinone methyltransferase/2-methoxy-6-polyprenyl-1,4-benzoquinol methylase UbiE [Candidatus Marinimicrobia bacterium]|nr:bifunctional demethylmenaquinone methyltransferase/2-methoxy-6-polyprenyl-1,4-benzoquinol methylase UbiE [Candidatus Neomarinimicrobiota bacterium]MCF7903789.1 bifunctional demethylmenaquinone methyltransferase/2-methoxy-6-polyprenyl-1,4-benzoquinol methylase UbiE [Candidatus Neomarinimicrobiota bacterium]